MGPYLTNILMSYCYAEKNLYYLLTCEVHHLLCVIHVDSSNQKDDQDDGQDDRQGDVLTQDPVRRFE